MKLAKKNSKSKWKSLYKINHGDIQVKRRKDTSKDKSYKYVSFLREDLKDEVNRITLNEKEKMQKFIDQYISSWDINGNGFYNDWIKINDNDVWISGAYEGEVKKVSWNEWKTRFRLLCILKIKEYALLPEEKPIKVYRGLEIGEKECKESNLQTTLQSTHFEGFGRYWSRGKEFANDWATHKCGLVFTGEVLKSDINWKETILQNIGQYEYQDERTIKKGGKVRLSSAEMVRKPSESKRYGEVEVLESMAFEEGRYVESD